MPVHNTVGSAVNLAKAWLLALDRASLETKVPTATLELLLQTLIDLGTPADQRKISDSAEKTVANAISRFSDAEKARG